MFTNTFLLLTTLLTSGIQAAPVAPVEKAAKSVVKAQLTANQAVERVQSFYSTTGRLTAKFRQTYTNATFGKKSISNGKVWIKKPGKMRWDYYKKPRRGGKARADKSFLSDGTMLWAVEHGNKQYFEKSLGDDMLPVAVTFLSGKGDLRKDFSAALDNTGTYGSKDDIVLKLTPRAPSAQYKNLWLVVNPENYRVTQSVVLEASGNINHFRFYEPDFVKPLKDAWFVLNTQALKGKYRLVKPKAK